MSDNSMRWTRFPNWQSNIFIQVPDAEFIDFPSKENSKQARRLIILGRFHSNAGWAGKRVQPSAQLVPLPLPRMYI